MTLPRILFVDDLYYWGKDARASLCQRLRIVDAEQSTRSVRDDAQALAEFFPGQTFEHGRLSNDLNATMEKIASGWTLPTKHRWALVILDLQFDFGEVGSGPIDPDLNWPTRTNREFGLEILEQMTRRWPDREAQEGNCEIPVVVLSTRQRNEASQSVSRAGASAYIEKEQLTASTLQTLLSQYGLFSDPSGLLQGRSLALLQVLRQARAVARHGHGNVLILGDRGTGKSALAEFIHAQSARGGEPLQKYHVGPGMDPSMLKAQLFGYWYGAFTPVDKSEAGLAERAHSGTLFLDEIGNLPPASQGELLEFGRTVEDGTRTLKRLGSFPTSPERAVRQAHESIVGAFDASTQTISVDVLLLTATNQPLDQAACRDRLGFLPDLFDRLGVEYHRFIRFPSLKERQEDIISLFTTFLGQASSRSGGRWPKVLDPSVEDLLIHHSWDGNVAELKGCALEVEKASRDWEEVLPRHLPNFGPAEINSVVQPQTCRKVFVRPAVEPQGPSVSELCATMLQVPISGLRSDMDGAMASLTNAYGDLVGRLLEAALELTRKPTSQPKSPILGDLNPTTAINLLWGRPHTSTQAAGEILRIITSLRIDPTPSGHLERAARWAESRRRGQGKKSKANE